MPPLDSAIARASDDLPLAVGAAISARGGFEGSVLFIATLIAADRLTRGDILAAEDAPGGSRGPEWGERGRPCAILLDGAGEAARRALEGLLPGVDVVVQPRE